MKRYFTGKPCPQGHISERLVKNAECVSCKIANYGKPRPKYSADGPDGYREKRRAYKAARRAAKRDCAVGLKPADLSTLRAKYGKRCAICGDNGRLTIDHIIPLKAGGQHVARNIQFLCHPCNSSKGARPMEDFARSRGLLL